MVREFLMQIKMKNESFKKYKEYYYSIYRDVDCRNFRKTIQK